MPKRDHTKLICDIGELSGLFQDAVSLEAFLQKTVEMVAAHMNSEVCSIYIYNDHAQELVLRATRGLNSSAIGRVRLRLGEGLTGLALKELRPLIERNASRHPGYRYFPEIGEELYESFLAVPITRGAARIGVMVVQAAKKNDFTEEDLNILRAVTSQLANIIETAKVFMDLNRQDLDPRKAQRAKGLKLIKGKVGSKGVACGEVVLWENLPQEAVKIDPGRPKSTVADFHRAVNATAAQLEEMQKSVEETLSDVASLIFTAQILMLKDQAFIAAVEALIKDQGLDASEAVAEAVKKYAAMFDRLEHPHLREKKQDVKDVGRRLLENLRGVCDHRGGLKDKIVIARELFPSEILKMSSQGVAGVILLTGGVTSHLSILARSLQIPLVIVNEDRLAQIDLPARVVLDAEQGNVHLNPSAKITETFFCKTQNPSALLGSQDGVHQQTLTRDGHRVRLLANINLLNDLKFARSFKAEGIGLYRTEFPFIVRSDFPSEEEQFIVYRKLVEGLPGKEVTFRTLDIGGDKVLSYYHLTREENPFLGMRSIRFSLKHKDIFAEQLRAILRAGHGADLRIMFPMISSLDELLEAKEVVRGCLAELKKNKVPHHPSPKIGLMVELPSVLEIMEALAPEIDFISIGTNDFVQYMLAVDRTNDLVAGQYLPEHPAVLRSLKRVADAGIRHGKEVSVCGDMAHEPRYIPYLLGIGIRVLSVDPLFIPPVQKFIEGMELGWAQRLTQKLIAQDRLQGVLQLMKRY